MRARAGAERLKPEIRPGTRNHPSALNRCNGRGGTCIWKDPMSSRLEHKLLGDIGATNARFALLAEGVLGPVEWLEVARYASFTDAVETFLNQHGRRLQITDALLAVAGPVEGGRCALTNCSWIIDAD